VSDNERDEPPSGAAGTSPLRVRPPEVTRLNRNALILVMLLAVITVLVAVMSMSNSRAASSGRADSAAARVPIVPQRPVLPPLRTAAPVESAATVAVAPPVPPEIAFEQRSDRSGAPGVVPERRSVARSRTLRQERQDAYRQALTRNPLVADRRQAQTTGEITDSPRHSREPADGDEDVERALLAPLLKSPSDAAPNGGQVPTAAASGSGIGDVSAVGQRAAREHREFLAESRSMAAPLVDTTALVPASSRCELTAGTAIDAALVTDLNSDLPGTVVAQVTRDVFDSRTEASVLVPKGSRLIGRYDDRVVPGQSRVLVAWTRLLFPDGRSVALPGVAATDGQGATGVPGHVNSHLTRVFEDAAVLSVLSAGAELSQPGASGIAFAAPSVGQTIGAAAGAQLASLGTEMVRQGLTIKPTIVVPAGASVTVLLADDLVFSGAYHDAR
jgi:type IV secretion system protein TrbI